MSDLTLSIDQFREALFDLLNETLEPSEGPHYYLDSDDDFRSTLKDVTAEQASILTGSCGNSVASQLRHASYHMEVGVGYLTGNEPEDVDWEKAWQQTSVTDEEWTQLQEEFWRRKDEMYAALRGNPPTFGPDEAAGAIGMMAHLAFHLGQIRHALCIAQDQ